MAYFSLSSPSFSFSYTSSMNGHDSISICDTVERTVMRNSSCIQMGNFEGRNALRLKTAFHSIRWIARIINVVTVTHDIQSAETIKPWPFNIVHKDAECVCIGVTAISIHIGSLSIVSSIGLPYTAYISFLKLYTKLMCHTNLLQETLKSKEQRREWLNSKG